MVAHFLDHPVRHPELVYPAPEDCEGEVKVASWIVGAAYRLVELEPEVNPALEIEAEVNHLTRMGGSGGAAMVEPERQTGAGDQQPDHQQSMTHLGEQHC